MAALTLAQALVGVPNKISSLLADEFVKSSFIFQNMPFESMAQAGGLGWVYQYQRLTTGSGAATRALNAEYTESQAVTTAYTVNLKVLGGSFKLDRAIADLNTNSVAMINFQVEQKKKAIIALFNDLMINGDAGSDATQFDGLNDALTGSSTEVDGASLDLSTAALRVSNAKPFLDLLDYTISLMDGTPSALLMNNQMLFVLKAIARNEAALQPIEQFGKQLLSYNGVPLVSLGEKAGSTDPVIATTTKLSDIYAVRFGLDGLHGVLPSNVASALNVYLPDLKTPGAVKTGEVELITAMALKTTKSAAKLKAIKVVA